MPNSLLGKPSCRYRQGQWLNHGIGGLSFARNASGVSSAMD
ncbi:hypothetical protein [Coleofasciculus chthonoplastes]|nr:hypothetical protein [Coleofasciculus chthonoplastes]